MPWLGVHCIFKENIVIYLGIDEFFFFKFKNISLQFYDMLVCSTCQNLHLYLHPILTLNTLCWGCSTSMIFCCRREISVEAGSFGICKAFIYHIIISYAISRELWHNSCFVVFDYGGLLSIDLTISFRVASLALWQSYDCHSNSQRVLKGADKHIKWVQQTIIEQKPNATKPVCFHNGWYGIFTGIHGLGIPPEFL